VEVSDQCGQVGVALGAERVAGPCVKLVLGQPALDERGLEHTDHLLAIGVRGPADERLRRCGQ
jgi:hypothetical protein